MKYIVMYGVFVTSALASSIGQAASPCQALTRGEPHLLLRPIEEAGQYCVTEDLLSLPVRQPNGDLVSVPTLLGIHHSDVAIDLQGHIAPQIFSIQDRLYANIQIAHGKSGAIALGYAGLEPRHPESLLSDLPAERLDDQKLYPNSTLTYGQVARADFYRYRNRQPAASEFDTTKFLLSHLSVGVDGGCGCREPRSPGVLLQGADNVIRHSTIEITDATGLYIFGPRALVEHNTIIIHFNKPLPPSAAAIKLDRADGTIIRHNRIVLTGAYAPKHAVSLIETQNLVFENNTLFGGESAFKTFDAQSSFVERGTHRYALARWRTELH